MNWVCEKLKLLVDIRQAALISLLVNFELKLGLVLSEILLDEFVDWLKVLFLLEMLCKRIKDRMEIVFQFVPDARLPQLVLHGIVW